MTRDGSRRTRWIGFLVVAGACLPALSCAEMNSIFREQPLKDGSSIVAVDAKQRFLITKPAANADETLRKICLEPSPDVFSVMSAAIEGSAKYSDKVAADLNLAMAETGATIGARTETIQLLRDSMYRICELALNGDMDKDEAFDLHQHYQKSMVTLAAVQALADVARPVQVAIGGKAAITRGTLMTDLAKKADEARKERDARRQASAEAAAKLAGSRKKVCAVTVKDSNDCGADAARCEPLTGGKVMCDLGSAGDTTDPEKRKAARAQAFCKARTDEPCAAFNTDLEAAAAAEDALEDAEAALAALEAEQDRVKGGGDLWASGGVLTIPAVQSQASPVHVKAVAKVVGNMVTQVYMEDQVKKCLDLVGIDKEIQEERKNLATDRRKALVNSKAAPNMNDEAWKRRQSEDAMARDLTPDQYREVLQLDEASLTAQENQLNKRADHVERILKLCELITSSFDASRGKSGS